MPALNHVRNNVFFSEARSACKSQRSQGWYKRCWEESTPPFPSDCLRKEKP